MALDHGPTRLINPAAIQRQIQALTAELLTLTTSKAGARRSTSAHFHMRQRTALRAHLDMRQQGQPVDETATVDNWQSPRGDQAVVNSSGCSFSISMS